MSSAVSHEVSTTASGSDEEDEICCNACGFEASFVPEGMLPCERCGDAHYCSVECLKWDWSSGGHNKVCVDRRPTEESSSSEDAGGVDLVPGVQGHTRANKSNASSFDSDDQSIMSMDIAKVFGLSPGSFDVRNSGSISAASSASASPAGSVRRSGSNITDTSGSSADVNEKKSFWEAKTKQDANNNKGPSSPKSPPKKGGTTSKLAAFFESQTSPKTPERLPAPLSPSKKQKLQQGGMLSSSGGSGKPQGQESDNQRDDSNGSDSMGEEDFGYAMGQHVVEDPMDESFDFMDKSVQTVGLKSIVEEGDSWSAEEPDLEGSWRSRNPFDLAEEEEQDGKRGDPQQQKRNNPPVKATEKNVASMLGHEASENDDHEESFWEAAAQRQLPPQASSYQQQQRQQQSNYIESDESYDEEIDVEVEEVSVEEEGSMEEESVEEEYEDDGEYEDAEYEDEEDYEDGYDEYAGDEDEEIEESEEVVEQSVTEDDDIEHSDRTPDEPSQTSAPKREIGNKNGHLTTSFRLQTKGNAAPPVKPYMPSNLLSNLSSHSEPAVKSDSDKSGNDSKRRRSFSNLSSSESATSRGAASLLDFRKLYSEKTPQDAPHDGLKDFREVYSGPCEDSISSETDLTSKPSTGQEANPNNTSFGSLNTDNSSSSKKSVNQALKTSINKALRDFERLYGAEAARAAVTRLTQAVGPTASGGEQSTTGAVVEAVVKENQDSKPVAVANDDAAPAKMKSLLDGAPKTPKRSERAVDRTLSPSSWAFPTGISVSSSETEDVGHKMPPGFGGKHPRSMSMPMIGGADLPAMKRENSFSSWGLTGMSVNSGGNKSDESAQGSSQPAGTPATTPLHVATVKEESAESSVQSGSAATTNTTDAPPKTQEPDEKSDSSRAFNGASLQTLSLGFGRKNKNNANGPVSGQSNHTQESNMVSSWAYGFGPASIRPEDDYHVARAKAAQKESDSSAVQWLADLASSSSKDEEKTPKVETVHDSSGDDDESLGHPFGDVEEDESMGNSFENHNVSEGLEASGHGPGQENMEVDETLGDLFSNEDENEKRRKDDAGQEAVSAMNDQSTAQAPDPANSKSPRYFQYRDILATKHLGKGAARRIDFDKVEEADDHTSHAETNSSTAVNPSNSAQQGSQPRYMKYRSKLSTTVLQSPTTDRQENDAPVEEEGNVGVLQRNDALSAVPSNNIGGSRLQQYRSTLAKRVHPNTDTPESESAKRAKNSQVLTPSTASDGSWAAPRYQKYRTWLANKVPTTGPENTINFDGELSRQAEEDMNKTALSGFKSQTPSEAVAPGNGSKLPVVPRYQQYRSNLARNVPVIPAPASEPHNAAATFTSESASENTVDGLDKIGLAPVVPVSQEATPVVSAVANDGPTPRYAKYRTSLADRLSTPTKTTVNTSRAMSEVSAGIENVTSTPSRDTIRMASEASETEDDGTAAIQASHTRDAAKVDGDEVETDEEFKAKLSSFLAKSEKGKKPPEIGDLDATDEAPTNQPRITYAKPPQELADDQSKKIAAALASSQLYLGRQKVAEEEPKESRLLSSEEPRASPGSAKTPRRSAPTADKGVSVKCGPPGKPSDIESGRSDPKVLEPTLSETELGRKLYLRNQCYAYGLLICLLVAMPLGIGLGIGLTRSDDDRDVPILFPTAPPSALSTDLLDTDSPTLSPGEGVVTSEPTSSPTFPSTPTPTDSPTSPPTPSTSAPTSSTSAPTPTTSAPTVALVDEDLFNLLASVSSDGGASIRESGSAQNDAYEWLAETDNLPSLSDNRRIQRYALATLFFSADGPSWSQSMGWLTDSDECTWFSTGSGETTCDEDGLFIALDLGFNGLMGTLPPELGMLTGLTRIDLSGGVGPGIGGTLPSRLSSLTGLEIFSIHDNAIAGPLFAGIGDLSDLRILNVRDNKMTGALPAEIGSLERLSFMDLSSNGFSGPVPDTVGNLANLVTLNIGNNAFTSLPLSMRNLGSLGSLKAPFNDLTGPLFDDWDGLGALQDLDLQSNNLSGALPGSLGQLEGLLELDLSNNQFISGIPESFGGLTNVLILRLNSNQLTGNVPLAFGDLQFVTELRVDDNDLAGALPVQVCDSFEAISPKFYLDCGVPELSCPPGLCCTYCCTDEVGCECVYSGTSLEYLC